MATLDTFRRGILPKATAEDVNHLLWNCTPYPFRGDVRKLRRSIRKHLRMGGGTVDGAVAYAHEELDRAFSAYQEAAAGHAQEGQAEREAQD